MLSFLFITEAMGWKASLDIRQNLEELETWFGGEHRLARISGRT